MAGQKQPQRRKPRIEEVEPRILYSADAAVLVAPLPVVAEHRAVDAAGEFIAQANNAQSNAAEHSSHEMVFVDTNTPDYQKLVDDIQSQSSAQRQIDVVLLDAKGDGIKQISSVLAGEKDLSAVHLISHGSDGQVQLGASTLNFDALLKNAAQIKLWGNALAADADLLIYGCDVAQNSDGKALVDALSRLTGADVAASENLTGAAAQGGDWNLEYRDGTIQTQVAVSYAAQLNWNYTLNTYTVTNTANSGAGSLSAAITNANNHAGADIINFNIAGGGVKTINVTSVLPDILEEVIIDGTTQGGYSGTPLIELNGDGAGAGTHGLLILAANSTVRGLIINGFGGAGIEINGIGSTGNVIQGNYLGTNAAGTAAHGNGQGVMVRNGATGNTIGGTAVGTGNVLSGNTNDGIDLWDTGTSNNVVLGNIIGLNAAGTAAVANHGFGVGLYAGIDNTIGGAGAGEGNVISGNWLDGVDSGANGTLIQGNLIGVSATGNTAVANGGSGIKLDDASGNTIGGTAAGARNVISGNDGDGVTIMNAASTGNVVSGNLIGWGSDGTTALGNAISGIELDASAANNIIGGTAVGAGNRIANSGADGVLMLGSAGSGNAILGNSIYNNAQSGIDLNNDGISANDANDVDSGPNGLQNFPVLTAASTNGTQISVAGTFNSVANKNYRLEFFSNAAQDGTGNGEGQTYLGFVNVHTDGSGNATFNTTLTAAVSAGAFISATATDPSNNTSEFAQNVTAATTTLVVDTANDVSDGNTTSIAALLASKGADGKISLREAITAANNTLDGGSGMVDLIQFAIAGAGVQTITLASALPTISDSIFIDGWSQGGIGYHGSPLIEINNNQFAGLVVSAGNSTLRGLIINNSNDDGLKLITHDGNTIVGNWFGLDATGTAAAANTDDGLEIHNSDHNTIGGLNSYERNVFSGNGDDGLDIDGDDNLIVGNWIGLNASGTAAVANDDDGVTLHTQGVNNTVGGTAAGSANVISGNDDDGVVIGDLGTSNNVIMGNIIGRDPTNTSNIGNGGDGVQISTTATNDTIGGTAAGAGNIIWGNVRRGINIAFDASDNAILGNSIYGNGLLGIDLNGDGVTANDGAGDADTGGNENANFPVLISANSDAGTITIVGSLTSASSSTYRIEFFASTTADATGHGEAERYLGFIDVTTDGAGVAAFTASLSGALTPGQVVVSATATDATNNTSELSANITGSLGPNTAPVLAGANNLTTMKEDMTSAANTGTLVSALIAGQITDPDGGALSGIAVTNVVNTNGTWQYSTNGGGSWTAFGAPGAATARLLAADASTYVRFVPNGDWNGTVSNGITFRAWDRTTGTVGGTANVTVNGGTTAFSTATASASITVNSVNDGPAGVNNTVTIFEDAQYTFATADFAFTDPADSPANALSAVKISTLPSAGSLTLSGFAVTAGQSISAANISGGLLKFAPAANGSGAGYTAFTFQIQDDGGTALLGVDTDPSPNTFTFNVTAVNDAPAGTDKTVTTQESTDYVFASSDFGFSDPNDSPANTLVAVTITTIPAAGSLTLSGAAVIAGQSVSAANIAAGFLKFTPAAGVSGAGYASFTFQVQDNGGTANGGIDLDASPNTMTVNVSSVNNAPAGASNTVTTNEDTAYVFVAADFGFSDAGDSPANNLGAVKIAAVPGTGSLTLSGASVAPGQVISAANIAAGNLRFIPSANASGAGYASFTFQVRDDGGTANGGVDLDPVARTMTVNVNAVDDAPVIAQNTLTLASGSSVTLSAAQLSATDVDNPAAGLLFNVSGISHGQFELASAPNVAILSFTQAQISAAQVRFVHDASSIAPSYLVSVSDGTLSTGTAAASIHFNLSTGPSNPGPVSPPPSTPSSPPPEPPAPPATHSAPVPVATVSPGPRTGVGGGDVAPSDGGEGGGGEGGGSGGGGGGGRRDTGAGRSVQAVVPRLSSIVQLKMSSTVPEPQAVPELEAGLSVQGSEVPYTKFEGSALADWSITSAYRDESTLQTRQREQFTVVMDSAEMGGIALSVGVVWWASRLTGAIGSLLASMPAWRQLDPLPIVGNDEEEEDVWDDGDQDTHADELAISMVLDSA